MKKILTILLGVLFVGLTAQTTTPPTGASTNENYVYSRTYLEAVTASSTTAKQVQGIQYFDGLGRPKQSIAIKASPLGRDVVTHIEYDPFGRQVKDYLPVPQSSSQNGTIYSSPLSNASASYGAEKIYSEKVLENSPLDRVLQQIQPGNDWTGKPIKFDYLTNIGDAVKKYTTTTTWAVANTDIYTTTSSLPAISTYADNTLYKNKVTDEDGNVSYEFKNGQGQTLLVRKVLSTTENADTYYVYNEYDQLALVIPPLAAVKTSLIQSDLDELCYQYRYDNQNRLVEKKLPGKGWEYMVYDQQDRLVLTQDAILRTTTNNFAKRGWLFTKYDQFGRVAYTGFFANTATRETMQKSLNSMSSNAANKETRDDIGFVQNGLTVYYTKTAFPTGSMTILSVNYYDKYPADLANIPTTVQGETILTATSQTTNKINTKSLPLASFVKNIDTDSWTKNYTFYDLKARAIGTHSYNYLGGYTKTESKLGFSGVATETYTYHKRLSSDTDITVKEIFEYDVQNRLIKHWHNVNNAATDELLTFNEYNELGQLKNKKVGGNATSPLQTVDYKYNIRGWMTGINDPTSLGTDLFGYKMKYNNPANTTLAPAKYNGNISEIDWKTRKDNNLRRYGYIYDNLNRLNIASYQKPEASVPETHSYDESIYYDLNGNILTLQRNGTTDGVAGTQIDDLEYYYTGNQLTKVVDVSANYDGYPDTSGNIISYDANGNMTSLLDKEIKTISYNFLNLPNKITFTGVIGRTTTNINTINSYRADGVKIKKAHQSPNLSGSIVTKTTDYLDGFQYETVNTEATALQFVPTSEGYYDFTKNLYIYNYVDHLGNVRLSYADSNKNGVIEPSTEIIEENNYYPFGLKHTGYNSLAGTPAYNYKYNGKELQETGMYDYGARFYMPDIGRWGVVDPLAEKYSSYSPYNYCVNNPVLYVDPDGRDGVVTGTGTADDPYVVTANYYYYGLSKDQVKGLNSSISDYNNKGNAREIKTKDGKIYVKFNLSAVESKDKESAIASAKGDMAEGADGKNVRWGNVVSSESLKGDALADADRMTIRSDNDKIVANSINGVNPVDVFRSTFNHEIGHNLGGVHGDPGGMMDPTETFIDTTQQITSGGPATSRYFNNARVTNDAVRAIMGRAGQTTQVTTSTGKVITTSYGIVNSIYLNAKENARVQQTDPTGSNGRISFR